MKVIHVLASDQRRGAEVFAAALVRSLSAHGVDQRVAVLRSVPGSGVRFDVPSIALRAEHPLPGIGLDLRAILELRRLLRHHSPDAIQVHGGESLKYVLAATGGRGERLVYRRIGDAEQFHGARWRRRIYAWLMRRAARVIAVADALRTDLIDRSGLAPEKVVTIPNGVDIKTLEPTRSAHEVRSSLGIDGETAVVLSLGALTWEKDPVAHIDVVARLATNGREVVHLIVGEGPLRSDVERRAQERFRPDRYRPLVLGNRADVADLLAASDALLLASRTEGMPGSVIEAAGAGVPVVAYAISGVPEVVEDGITGRLVPAGDEDALTSALGEVLGDVALRERMAEAARSRCRTRFAIDEVAASYLRVYEQVATRSVRPA